MNANNLFRRCSSSSCCWRRPCRSRAICPVMDGSSRVVRVFEPLERALYRVAGVDAGSR